MLLYYVVYFGAALECVVAEILKRSDYIQLVIPDPRS